MSADAVALVSRDPELTGDVRRLCAAAGQQLHVVSDPAEMPRLRRRHGVLLVDAASPDIPAIAEPDGGHSGADRSAEVIVLTASPDTVDPWRTAVRAGARQVLTLPADSRRLLDALALAHEAPGATGPLVGVVGGCGGAGASTLAAALASAAASRGARATLVDLDPIGGGADLLLGLERDEGLRWPDLVGARGVVPAAALHERLPRVGRLAILACGRLRADESLPPAEPPVQAVTAVVAASRRADGAVVVDLPRWSTDAADAVVGSCDLVVTVVPAEVRAVASAALTINRLAALCDDIRVVLRRQARGRLDVAQIRACLGRPVAATVPADARVAAAADRGELFAALGRSRLGATAMELWVQLSASTFAADKAVGVAHP